MERMDQTTPQAGNGVTRGPDQVLASIPEISATEGGNVRKRDYAAVQDGPDAQIQETVAQPSKRLRNDRSERLPFDGLTFASETQSNDAEPQLIRGSEGITSFGNKAYEKAVESANELPSNTASSDDDSDEFEMPPINTQLADDLLCEEYDEEDVGDEDDEA